MVGQRGEKERLDSLKVQEGMCDLILYLFLGSVMNDSIIVATVASRWGKKVASNTLSWWFDNSDEVDLDEFSSRVQEDQRDGKGYISRCRAASAYFQPLAGPLMSPKIKLYSERLESRANEVGSLLELEKSSVSLAKKVWNDYKKLVESNPSGGFSAVAKEIKSLPSVSEFMTLAKKCADIDHKIYQEENDGTESYLNWTLEDYIGNESGLAAKLGLLAEKSSWVVDWMGGASLLYGFFKYLLSSDTYQEIVDNIPEK